MSNQKVVACDVGGSHITAGVVDLGERKVLEEHTVREHVDSQGSKEEILNIWKQTIERLLKESKTQNVTFAMPGPFDYARGISKISDMGKYESLYDVNIREYLSERLKIAPEKISFRNDAEAFLHGEVVVAEIPSKARVLGFTLGTGLGAAFSTNGITEDRNYGSDLYKDSIADEYFSTRWFEKEYKKRSGNSLSGVADLSKLAEGGDETALIIFHYYGEKLGQFINERIHLTKADTLVIGGNIAKAKHHFEQALLANLSSVNLIWASQGEYSALLGSAFIKEFEG
jgi:glucokinase